MRKPPLYVTEVSFTDANGNPMRWSYRTNRTLKVALAKIENYKLDEGFDIAISRIDGKPIRAKLPKWLSEQSTSEVA